LPHQVRLDMAEALLKHQSRVVTAADHRRGGIERSGLVEMVHLDEDLPGNGVAASGDHTHIAEVIVAPDKRHAPDIAPNAAGH
jgi:hypothetical protein